MQYNPYEQMNIFYSIVERNFLTIESYFLF